MAAWKRRSDMRKVCGNIFEDHNVQLYLKVHRRFGGDLVKSSGYTMTFISICRIFEKYRNVRVFVAVDLKFVQMLS